MYNININSTLLMDYKVGVLVIFFYFGVGFYRMNL